MSAERLLGIPQEKPTVQGRGAPYRKAQRKGSPGPRAEAVGVLVEMKVPGELVASGQTAPGGAPASP